MKYSSTTIAAFLLASSLPFGQGKGTRLLKGEMKRSDVSLLNGELKTSDVRVLKGELKTSNVCGQIFSEDLILADDVECLGDGPTLIDGAKLDCDGHTITGPGHEGYFADAANANTGDDGWSVGVQIQDGDGSEVKDCTIIGYSAGGDTGIWIKDSASQVTIENVIVSENWDGIWVDGDEATLRKLVLENNIDRGIHVEKGHDVEMDDVFVTNSKDGIFVDRYAERAKLKNINAENNQRAGIYLEGDDVELDDVFVTNNGEYGILISRDEILMQAPAQNFSIKVLKDIVSIQNPIDIYMHRSVNFLNTCDGYMTCDSIFFEDTQTTKSCDDWDCECQDRYSCPWSEGWIFQPVGVGDCLIGPDTYPRWIQYDPIDDIYDCIRKVNDELYYHRDDIIGVSYEAGNKYCYPLFVDEGGNLEIKDTDDDPNFECWNRH